MSSNTAVNKPDFILIIVVVLLTILGMLILASVSAAFSLENFGNPYYFLIHQFIWGVFLGAILLFLTLRLPLELLRRLAPLFLLINIILVAMVFLPKIGVSSGGATRWLSLGGKITFQPSEFLKLTFILYLASLLASHLKNTARFRIKSTTKTSRKIGWEFTRTLVAFFAVMGLVSLLLIFQPDISTLGTIILVGFLMYFAAGTPLWHNLLMMLIGAGGLFLLIKFAAYRLQRWLVFLNPEADPLGMGYQVNQALIAVGSGGILGLGLGMSRQKFGFLPQPMSDSIFAIFSEETGFLGAAVIISLFLIFWWQAIKISKAANDGFLRYTALGISSWIALQALANIGAMIGILPLAGIPLPFISYGGSHVAAELAGVGILLNISKNAS